MQWRLIKWKEEEKAADAARLVVKLKKYFIYFLILIISIASAYSHAEDFAEAKQIIDAKTPCSKLAESQLEVLGDYFMEQMHPGEVHEAMDKMMGGEGSESLRQVHIAIAKRIYCNDASGMANYGMTGMMKGGMTNMMSTNMMNFGMMGNYGYGFGYWGLINLLSIILMVGLIALVYLWIIKTWKSIYEKKSK